jgi:hypothetical protein
MSHRPQPVVDPEVALGDPLDLVVGDVPVGLALHDGDVVLLVEVPPLAGDRVGRDDLLPEEYRQGPVLGDELDGLPDELRPHRVSAALEGHERLPRDLPHRRPVEVLPPHGVGVRHPEERPLGGDRLGRFPPGGLGGLGVQPVEEAADDGVELPGRGELPVVGPEPLHQLREVLGLPLRVGVERLAEQRLEQAVLGEGGEGGVDPALAELALRAVGDRPHVVEEHLGGRPPEVEDGVEHAPHERGLGPVERHLDVLGPREAEDHQEDAEPQGRPVPRPERHVLLPVDLGLLARGRLEAHRGDPRGLLPERAAVVPHQPVAPGVPERLYEAVQGHRRAGLLELLPDDRPERVDLGRLGPPGRSLGGFRPVPGLEPGGFGRPVVAAHLAGHLGEVGLSVRFFLFAFHFVDVPFKHVFPIHGPSLPASKAFCLRIPSGRRD